MLLSLSLSPGTKALGPSSHARRTNDIEGTRQRDTRGAPAAVLQKKDTLVHYLSRVARVKREARTQIALGPLRPRSRPADRAAEQRIFLLLLLLFINIRNRACARMGNTCTLYAPSARICEAPSELARNWQRRER